MNKNTLDVPIIVISNNQLSPLKIYLDFSLLCNLSCLHCITNSSPTANRKSDLSTEQIIHIIRQLELVNVSQLAIGGGEIFAYKDWEKIIDELSRTNIKFTITTNGTLLTNKQLSILTNYDPYEMRVSFDGSKLLHDEIRGAGSYHKAISACGKLLEYGFNTTARVTICNSPKLDNARLFSDLQSCGIKTMKFAVAKSAGRAKADGKKYVWQKNTDQLAQELTELAIEYNMLIQLSSDDFTASDVILNDTRSRNSERKNCGAGFETGYVAPNGDLLGCVTIPNIIFGNLKKHSFLEAWNSEIATQYRQLANLSGERRICDELCSSKCNK